MTLHYSPIVIPSPRFNFFYFLCNLERLGKPPSGIGIFLGNPGSVTRLSFGTIGIF